LSDVARRQSALDAVVIGAGPNGLVAAITLAEAGLAVHLVEAAGTIGGGTRSAPLTLPGFVHDVCSSVHPLARIAAPLRAMPLERFGLDWIEPPLCLAHPLDDGSAAVLARSIDETIASFDDEDDARAYENELSPLVGSADELFAEILGPLRLPKSPLVLSRFGARALRSCVGLARGYRTPRARALLAGCAAHSFLPLDHLFTASFALVFPLAAHASGWPIPRGGAQSIADALGHHFRSLGGTIETGRPVRTLRELPSARAYLFDVTPRALALIAGDALPASYRRRLGRFRYGPGVFKIDYALDGPIPWTNPECARASTVHLGGTLEELVASEQAVWRGALSPRPFVLVTQPTLFDQSRAPQGMHVAWAYCHVPAGSGVDHTDTLEAQIERFAPGFKRRILARRRLTGDDLEAYNANYVGGDINGGALDGLQLFARPVLRHDPYATPNPSIYLCSSSTPPGGGVHGMCGWFAARSALARTFGANLKEKARGSTTTGAPS
jgi:phytoene dehydrogenase-like protein